MAHPSTTERCVLDEEAAAALAGFLVSLAAVLLLVSVAAGVW